MNGLQDNTVYDPKPDLDAFFQAVSEGIIGQADPDAVTDLIDRVSSHPGQTFRSLRMNHAAPFADRESVATPMFDMYANSAIEEPVPDLDDGFSRFLDDVVAKVHVSDDDIVAAADDSVAFDRLMETYYRS